MPRYDFWCPRCDTTYESDCKYDERNDQKHECGEPAIMVFNKPPGGKIGYQFSARFGDPVTGKIMGDMKGHLGKSAPRRKKK